MTAADDHPWACADPPPHSTGSWSYASAQAQHGRMCVELDRLREQVARQAPVIEAAEGYAASHDHMVGMCRASVCVGAREVIAAVRALSVPAPPEATEVTG